MTIVDAGIWTADLTETRAGFTARGMGRPVPGTIPVTSATVEVDAAGRPVRLSATLDPAAIDTGNARRDKDLRGKRFLKVDRHPLMTVSAEQFEQTADGWGTDAVVRVAGAEAPLRIEGALTGPATGTRLRVTGTARLDLRSIGIRVPGFVIGRFVEIAISAAVVR